MKRFVRSCGGQVINLETYFFNLLIQVWEDPSLGRLNQIVNICIIMNVFKNCYKNVDLAEWDPNDFRIFCGDLGNEVSDELLAKAFRKYPSFQKAKVVRDSRTNKSKGFGFVSFKNQEVTCSELIVSIIFTNLGFYSSLSRDGRKICWKSTNKIAKE